MIPLGDNQYLCKFCHEALKKTWCFVPNCQYFSGPPKSISKEQADDHNSSIKTIKETPRWLRNSLNHTTNRQKWPRFHAIIAYDGYDFSGWQCQPHKNTVQDKIEIRLSSYFRTNITVRAASRTDAKVHANGQSIHFDAPFDSYVSFFCLFLFFVLV